MVKLITTILLACTLPLSGCNEKSAEPAQADVQPAALTEAQPQPSAVSQEQATMVKGTVLTGTIVYKTFEGGFFALIGDDGKPYTLHGLARKYQQNGLKVRVTGEPKPDMMTITQFGTVFKVESVEILDDSMVRPIDPTH